MGLFNRNKNKKSPEEQYRELHNENMANIKAANYNVRIDFAVGQYGNEDIIAGSMIGSTGKYLMMGKYGDLKWASTTMALLPDSVQIHYNGTRIFYSSIIEVRVSDNTRIVNGEKQLVLATTQGEFIFKGQAVFIDTIIYLILITKDQYNTWIKEDLIKPGENLTEEDFSKLLNGEPLERDTGDKTKDESNMDRLIRLGELHERGLLSDEEFAEAKKKLL